MDHARRPRILLGNLGPIMRMGMSRVLTEQGCEVVGQEDRPSAIVGAAHRLRPDIVVLDLDGGSAHQLGRLVARSVPETTVVLWAREEDLMEVIDPVSSTTRAASPLQFVERLRSELSGQHVHEWRSDMPTYLTPGVYVEEVPSASKPIEGVSTSIAAFVGLAPGGPVNTPMRISNWTQFAKIFGDPERARQRPVHGGRVPRALRLRVLPERRQPVLGRARRRRRRQRRRRRARRCRRRPTRASRRFRAVALESGNGDVKVELDRGALRGRRRTPTRPTSSSSTSGAEQGGVTRA